MKSKTTLTRRKFLQIGLGAAGAVGLASLTACAPRPAAPASEPTAASGAAGNATTEPAPTSVPAAAGQSNLRLLTWASGGDLDLHKKAFDLFAQANTTVKVEAISVPFADYYTKVQTEAAGGNLSDVVNIGEAYTSRWAQSKVIVNMNQFIKEDSGFDQKDFFPNVLENFMYEGGVYVLPKDYVTWGLFYNKTLFDAAGMPVPDDTWTWSPDGQDKYTDAAKKLTKQEGSRTVQYGTMAPAGWGYWVPRVKDVGGHYLDDTHKKCVIDTPESTAAIQWIGDLINKYKVAPSAEAEQGGFNFASGKVAMMPQGTYMVPGLLDAKFEWSVAPHPQGPKSLNSVMFSSGYAISSQSKFQQDAWKLASFMTRGGSELLAKSGFSIPSRQSVAAKPGMFVNDKTKPHNVQVFLDASKYMSLHEISPTWTQEEQAITAELSLVMSGEKTAQDAVKAFVPKVNELLTKGA